MNWNEMAILVWLICCGIIGFVGTYLYIKSLKKKV